MWNGSYLSFLFKMTVLSIFWGSLKGSNTNVDQVDIYHLINNELWGEVDGSFLQGNFPCANDDILHPQPLSCNIFSSDSKDRFIYRLREKYLYNMEKYSKHPITVGLYSIHSWKPESFAPYAPDSCILPTMLNMVESEESFSRFGHLFRQSFPYYHGNSTTLPWSSVPRSYVSSLNASEFLPLVPFSRLLPAASYVASTCHVRGPVQRDELVRTLRHSFRVDGLGKCSHSIGPGGVDLKSGRNPMETLHLKQEAISKYMFYLAFENSKEPGYVTEKVFDALKAGTVPIYLGATEDCKRLIPWDKAVIYLDDFTGLESLGNYISYLMTNETAYSEHRQWRHGFQELQLPSILRDSWPCRVCKWARNKYLLADFHTEKVRKSSKRQCEDQ